MMLNRLLLTAIRTQIFLSYMPLFSRIQLTYLKTMKLKLSLFAALACAFISIGSAQQELLLNGDFSTATYSTTADNNLLGSDASNGWATKSHSAITLSGGVGTWAGSSITLLQDSLAQANAVGSATGSSLTVSFDWTPIAGSANADLNYQLVAWKADPAALDISTVQMIRFINSQSRGIGGTATGGTLTSFDLIAGTNGSTGNINLTELAVSGTAGATTNYSLTYDISSYGAGFSDISDFTYVGIRFTLDGDVLGTTAMGSFLDNVSLSTPSAVPEPSSFALLGGLGALGFVAMRRRRS